MDFARSSRGSQVARLGSFYAQALRVHLGDRFDVLFGPAYKGIPLVVATALALAREHDRDVSFCFNRKGCASSRTSSACPASRSRRSTRSSPP